MPRQMKNAEYRLQQCAKKFDYPIGPINQLVCELNENNELKVPFVAPIYGGVNARMLSIMRDPGPMADEQKGSGFIGMENDDPTAERLCNLCERHLQVSDLMLWNSYPWYINSIPKVAQLKAGLEPLKRLLDLLPNLRVIMLHGVVTKDSWKFFGEAYPEYLAERNFEVIATYHTSNQAFIHKDPAVRAKRKQNLEDAYAQAAEILQRLKGDVK